MLEGGRGNGRYVGWSRNHLLPITTLCTSGQAHPEVQRRIRITRTYDLATALAVTFSRIHPHLFPLLPPTLFSSANPQNVLKNLRYIEEPIDWALVRKVKEIIGDQQRVSWANS